MKGVVKVISKMGISTIQKLLGAQIFEAIGLQKSVVAQVLSPARPRDGRRGSTSSPRVLFRHQRAFPDRRSMANVLEVGGQYQWRDGGEYHLFNPQTIHKLQHAVRTSDFKGIFRQYIRPGNEQTRNGVLAWLARFQNRQNRSPSRKSNRRNHRDPVQVRRD